MTEHRTSNNDDAREVFERGRAAFGAALVAAAEGRDGRAVDRRPARRRRGLAIAGGLALAGGIAALAIGIPSPSGVGSGDDGRSDGDSVIGPSSALAAVTAMRDSLRDGVLFRDAVLDQVDNPLVHSRIQDWTDLATRHSTFEAPRASLTKNSGTPPSMNAGRSNLRSFARPTGGAAS